MIVVIIGLVLTFILLGLILLALVINDVMD